MKTRNLYYDYLRVMAMVFVIGVHSVGSIERWATSNIAQIETILLSRFNTFGVPIFFALSGVFLLGRGITQENLWVFYKKRLLRLGIPYLIYAVIYVAYFTGIEQKNIPGIPLAYVKDILTANVHGTHWFVYAILGLYFVTPFLAKMFQVMSDKEIGILLAGCLILNAVNEGFSLLGMHFGIENIIFNCDPVFMFIGGYCANRICDSSSVLKYLNQRRILFIPLFVLVYICTEVTFFRSISIIMFMVAAHKSEVNKRKCLVVSSLAQSSYSIYLLHAAVVSLVLKLYSNWKEFYEIKVILLYVIVLTITFILAKIIDFILTDRIIRKVSSSKI